MNAAILVLILFLSLYLTRRAAGTLRPGELNSFMLVMYLFYLSQFLGAILISLDYTGHYMAARMIDQSIYEHQTIWLIAFVSVAFPLFMLLFNKLWRFKAERQFTTYFERPVVHSNESLALGLFMAAGLLCLALLAAYFIEIGYIPLLRLFGIGTGGGFDFNTERIRINGIYVIHPIVRNIAILLAIPLLSYLSFAYMLASRRLAWKLLFVVFFAAAVLTRTHNFEKSPLVFHLVVYLLIFIYTKGAIKMKLLFIFGAVCAAILAFMYLVTFRGSTIWDLYNGPFARIVLTPVGVLAFNLELFPAFIPFLRGRSLPATLLPLFGFSADERLRSANVLMEFYGSEAVYENRAGVMSSFFTGEAYANFGLVGILFSLAWVAALLSTFNRFILLAKKTPALITLHAYMVLSFAQVSQGGFVDFLFNVSWIVVAGSLILLHWLTSRDRSIRLPGRRRQASLVGQETGKNTTEAGAQ